MDILVAYDGSRESEAALVNGLDILDVLAGSLTAVYANSGVGRAPDEGDESSEVKRRGERIFESAIEHAERHDTSISTEQLAGDPIEVIPEFAEQHDFDVIYVGHRGLRSSTDVEAGGGRGPLGSVARGLVENTQIPVTVFDGGL